MKAVLLAGGRGTRLFEETQFKPKPLVEAGGETLLWHIMQNYSRFGIEEFIILAGYKGIQIKEYFSNFWLREADVSFNSTGPTIEFTPSSKNWKVTVIDTGLDSQTGKRLNYLREILNEDFCLTYGDGVADVDIEKLIAHHQTSKRMATLTAVQPPARFGALTIVGTEVVKFNEKPTGDGSWINGGYFVLSPEIFDQINSGNESFEVDVLPRLAELGQLDSFKHYGFWQPVDSLRDIQRLEIAIKNGSLPWLKETSK